MNLDEIRLYRKLLKLQKAFCCTLALTTILSLPSNSCKKNNSNNVSMNASVSLEGISNNILNVTKGAGTYYKAQQISNQVVNNINGAWSYVKSLCELSYPEKMLIIMDREKLTYEELDRSIAGMIAESCEDGNNYDECYRTMSTLFNRKLSKKMVDYVSSFGVDGTSLINQFEAKNQFAVYAHRSYEKYLGRIDLKGYQACIDMLYSGIPSHDYIQFNDVPPKRSISYEQYISNGNYYYNELKENEKISNEMIDNNAVMNDNMKRVLDKN